MRDRRAIREILRVVMASLGGQRLDARAGGERRGLFVEPNVPIGPDPEQLEVDPAHITNLALVLLAGQRDFFCQTIRHVDVLRSARSPVRRGFRA